MTLSDTTHSVGALLTREQSVAEKCTCQHTNSQKTDIHGPAGMETHNTSN